MWLRENYRIPIASSYYSKSSKLFKARVVACYVFLSICSVFVLSKCKPNTLNGNAMTIYSYIHLPTWKTSVIKISVPELYVHMAATVPFAQLGIQLGIFLPFSRLVSYIKHLTFILFFYQQSDSRELFFFVSGLVT